MLRHWLPLLACCAAALALPFPSSIDDETDGEASRKVLGSSVVTSVSVIMDLGNGTKKYYADAAGKPVPKPTSASMLGSPPDLLHPDRYEFYTFNEAGDLVKRLMTLEEIQGIIASGDGESGELPPNYYHQELPAGLKSPTLLGEGEIGELSSPVEGVHEVVESVQNVLKEEMEAAKNKTPSGTTSRPATTHPSTWTPGELMDTSTSVKTSTATTPTTYRPSSRKPVKKPTTHIPTSRRPITTTSTTSSTTTTTTTTTTTPKTRVSSATGMPSSTMTPPQKIFSRRPISSSSQLPPKQSVPTTTENPHKSPSPGTTRYSTKTASTSNLMTTESVSEKGETTSKTPITDDFDGNLLDNEVSFASASNINSEILNNTRSNATEVSSDATPTQEYSEKDESVTKFVTSNEAIVADKSTEYPTTENNKDSEFSTNDNEYSADSSVTSIQNIKPSVTVIANSAINTISGPTSTGKPGFQNVPNNGENAESTHSSGDLKPIQSSSTSIQNVEPIVTVIINSTVNTASGATTASDPISIQPLYGVTGTFFPGPPNLQYSPTSTVTERIAVEGSSQEYTTTDSSSEEESSENSNSIELISTELPDDILSTLLQLLKADVTTQSSGEYEPSESEIETSHVAKTNKTVASLNIGNGQVDTDMAVKINASIADNIEKTVASPSEISTTNSTEIAEHLQLKPSTNEPFFMERNQSISSIVEMLMDKKPISDPTESLMSAQNALTSDENVSISLQGETKMTSNESTTQNNNVSATGSNTITDILTPAQSQSGTVVLYANNLLAQTEKSDINTVPPKSSLIPEEKFNNKTQTSTTSKNTDTETSVVDFTVETTTNSGLVDADSATYVMNETSTEVLKSSAESIKNTEESTSVTENNTKVMDTNTSHNDNKIPAPSIIDEVIENETIPPDSYFVIGGDAGSVEESDLLAPPVEQNFDSASAIKTQATNKEQVVSYPDKYNISKTASLMTDNSTTNGSEIQNTEAYTNITSASSDKKYSVTKLNHTEKHTTISPLTNAEVTTKMIETADDNEKVPTTSIMSDTTTKKPVITTHDSSAGLVAANSGFIALKISPELEESVSNVLSQVSNKTATTILATDKEIISDTTTQITTTNFDDSTTQPLLSSTTISQLDKSSEVMLTTNKNITGTVYNISVGSVPQDTNITQGHLKTAETNNILNTLATRVQETTTHLYSSEMTTIFSTDDKVQSENEAPLSSLMKQKNESNIDENTEDTKEIEIETRVDVKNRGNVSDENMNVMLGLENEKQNAQPQATVTTQDQYETHTAASSLVDERTDLSERQNGSLGAPSETESSTIVSHESDKPKLAEPAEETSTISFAENSNDVTTVNIQMAKHKPQDTVDMLEADERPTTLLPTFVSTENTATDKLLLASQIKGTQVKLIDNEEEQMLKVEMVTVPNRENSAGGVANQTALEEMSTSTWQKIFDSSEKGAYKSTTSKFVETNADTESIKETNYVEITSTGAVKNISDIKETSTLSDVKGSQIKQNIENVLESGNSIISQERPEKTSDSIINKNTSKVIIVPGITEAIFHTEIYDHIATTEEPVMTTTNFAKLDAETILPSKYVENIANPESTSAEAMNTEVTSTENARTEYASNETATEMDVDNEVKTTDKAWSLVSTEIPPQTKMTTSRTADQTTKAHTDMRVTTLADSRRPAHSPTVDLHPAPEENLGLESTTFNLEKDVSDFTELCNELALKLWKPVANKRATVSRSLVMSPFAVTSLLAMVFLGARGGTSGQMNDILRLDDMVTFNPHQVFRNVTESLVMTKNPGVATAAFVRELYSDKAKGKLLDFYKERAQQFYEGHVEEVNFNMVGDVVRRRTNLLVKRQTNGKVPEYIRGSNIMLRPPLSVFSANIFQTDCSAASTSGRDGEMYFTVMPASRQRRLVPVPAVVWRSGFLAGYDPMLDATAVAIGGADSLVSTVLVLPGQQGNTAPGDSVAALEDRLWDSPSGQDAWSRLLRSLLPRPGLELQLPRFSHRSMLNMTGALQRMGLKDLFSEGRADLKGLNGLANDLHLSDIVQVNTFGTCGELAADARHHVEVFPGTSQRVGRRGGDDDGDLPELRGIPLSLRPRQARLPEAPRLRLDRPFLYAVRHNPTGLILHMGRFNPRLVR